MQTAIVTLALLAVAAIQVWQSQRTSALQKQLEGVSGLLKRSEASNGAYTPPVVPARPKPTVWVLAESVEKYKKWVRERGGGRDSRYISSIGVLPLGGIEHLVMYGDMRAVISEVYTGALAARSPDAFTEYFE